MGADQYPFHVFQVDPQSGFIRVNKLLDREEIALYNVSYMYCKINIRLTLAL